MSGHSTNESEYSKKLRDPRWQKMRLQILERDGWCCQKCFDPESTLHVHHLRYVYGLEPWEYKTTDLITLCESCHQYEYEARKESENKILFVLKVQGWWADEVDSLANCIGVYGGLEPMHPVTKSALAWALSSPKGIELIAALYDEYRAEFSNRRKEEEGDGRRLDSHEDRPA